MSNKCVIKINLTLPKSTKYGGVTRHSQVTNLFSVIPNFSHNIAEHTSRSNFQAQLRKEAAWQKC